MLEVLVREAWARAWFNGEIAIWDLLLGDASGLVPCEAVESERGLLGFWVELCLEPAAHSGHQPTSALATKPRMRALQQLATDVD
jgi:hypothetical protein